VRASFSRVVCSLGLTRPSSDGLSLLLMRLVLSSPGVREHINWWTTPGNGALSLGSAHQRSPPARAPSPHQRVESLLSPEAMGRDSSWPLVTHPPPIEHRRTCGRPLTKGDVPCPPAHSVHPPFVATLGGSGSKGPNLRRPTPPPSLPFTPKTLPHDFEAHVYGGSVEEPMKAWT
jgi:hypothetical protein